MASRLKLLPLSAALLLGTAWSQGQSLELLGRIPHDTSAFTQGLQFVNGRLFESTGLRGESTLRELDPASGEVLRQIGLEDRYFGEGLTAVGDSLVMLTWQENKAFVFDRESFEQTGSFSYEGEGWGLCNNGSSLVMSDGSDVLQFRDLDTFELTGTVAVTQPDGRPLPLLNELECVGDDVYANVFTTTYIVRITPDGSVDAVYDLRNLLTAAQWAELGSQAVLNGIAWNPETDTFLVTGKLWPWMFELRID